MQNSMLFLRKTTLDTEPMPIKMSAVRMGERLLQIGVDHAKLAAALAAKVGLSGAAAIVVTPGDEEVRAREAVVSSGALVDVRVAPRGALPFDEASFDVVVVNAMSGLLASLAPEARQLLLSDARRTLRTGGRIVLLEPGPREGIRAFLRPFREDPAYLAAGRGEGALQSAGFKPVRALGERDGYRFTEGLKT
jgi:SAM-dependent methyltransferase